MNQAQHDKIYDDLHEDLEFAHKTNNLAEVDACHMALATLRTIMTAQGLHPRTKGTDEPGLTGDLITL